MSLFDFFKKKKDANKDIPQNDPALLSAKLFFAGEPFLDDNRINAQLKRHFTKIKFADEDGPKPNSRHYFFEDYEVKIGGKNIPAQGVIFMPDKEGVDLQQLETSFTQNYNWEGGVEIVRSCNYEIILSELMTRTMDYKDRVACFQKFVASIIFALQPNAVWLSLSDRIMDPSHFMQYYLKNDCKNLSSLLNVRLFNLDDGSNDTIMDTLGLHGLGLHDLEIRFGTDYNPPDMASLLFNYGNYIFENGNVFKHGSTCLLYTSPSPRDRG